MRRWMAVLVFTALAAGLSQAATFQGEIADSSCAMNVHSLSRSHKEMLRSKSFGPDAASCTRRCVEQFGSSYVLVVKKDVYRLDNQTEAGKWAGQMVTVTGELDAQKNTITVKSIEVVK